MATALNPREKSRGSEAPANRHRQSIQVRVYRLPTSAEALRSILRYWWIVLFITGIGVGAGILVAKKFDPRYRSSTYFRLLAPSETEIGDDERKEENPDGPLYMMVIAHGLKDAQVVGPLVEKYRKLVLPKLRKNLKAVTAWIIKELIVEWRGGNDYEVRVRSRSPALAKALAAALGEYTMERHRNSYIKKAVAFAATVDQQLERTSKTLKGVEDRMVAFLGKHPVLRLKSLDSDVHGSDRLRTGAASAVRRRSLKQLAEKNPELRALLDRKRQLSTELETLTQAGSGATRALTEALDRARRALAEARAGKTDSHPVVKRALVRVKAIEAQIAAAAPGRQTAGSTYESKLRAELTLLKAKIRHIVGKMATKVKRTPVGDRVALEAQWSKMRREHQRLRKELSRLEGLKINAELRKNLQRFERKSMARLLDTARLPESPIGLHRKAIVIAISVFFFLGGLVAAILVGLLDVRIQNPAQIALSTEDLEVLAVLHDQGKDGIEPSTVIPLTIEPKAASAPSDEAPAEAGMRWLKDLDLDSALDAMAPADQAGAKGAWSDAAATGFFDANAPAALGARAAGRKAGGADASAGAMVLASELPAGARSGPQATPQQRVHPRPANLTIAPGVFTVSSPRGKAAEQIRLLAARIRSDLGKNLQSVSVTSWERGVGRTMVAANLAMVLSQSQTRVLMIDACPHTAALTQTFGIQISGAGLFEQLQRWLDRSASPWEVVQVAENLNIIPAVVDADAPALPLLLSEAFVRLIADMKQLYDVLVIDTDALQVVSDSIVLRPLVDGYLMVTRRSRSTTRALRELGTRLPKEDIFGVVFNQHA